MKRRTILWLTAAAVLIAAAFALPPLALKGLIARTTRAQWTLDASDQLLTAPKNMAAKLSCFTDPEVIATQPILADQPEAVLETLLGELAVLYELGALSPELYEQLLMETGSPRQVDRFYLLRSAASLAFEVYSVNLTGASHVVLDAASGKVLCLSCAVSGYGLLDRACGEEGDRELEGWAAYFGLSLGPRTETNVAREGLANIENPQARYSAAVLKEATLTDSEASAVQFGLIYEFWGIDTESYTWGPCR